MVEVVGTAPTSVMFITKFVYRHSWITNDININDINIFSNSIMKKKMLITGAAGFLGKLAYEYFKYEFEIIAADKNHSNLENFYKVDITNQIDVENIISKEKPDIIIHFASEIFDNISADLMYAFYGQNIDDWVSELENFLSFFNLQHLSLYQLTIEEGTKFFKDHKNGKIKLIDNDVAAEFYNISDKVLNDFKFKRYEVSNYAKKNFKCKHNLNYWNSENWIGIGPGAYGRLWSSVKNKSRIEYQNYKNPKTWLSKNLVKSKFEKITKLNTNVSDIDTLTMGLRLYEGLEISSGNF